MTWVKLLQSIVNIVHFKHSEKVEIITYGWTVDTVANAANVANMKYFRNRGNYSLAYEEFITLPFCFYGKPNNDTESAQNLARVWCL